jgi:hypothetical protein
MIKPTRISMNDFMSKDCVGCSCKGSGIRGFKTLPINH